MKRLRTITGAAVLSLAVVACDNDDSFVAPAPTPAPPAPPAMASFEVSITNLTAGQPFSPLAVVAHGDVYETFQIGEAATTGLEELAEGGDNTNLLAEADADGDVTATASGDGIIAPGATGTVSFSVLESDLTGLQLSAITMLVNTNDAITGVRSAAIGSMAVGDSVTMNAITYDAGTEANTEAAGTIPGPADGGEGTNTARDDIADEVRGHTGVVTSDDGLPTSVLTEAHRWDNPTARVTISRVAGS